MRVGAVIPVRYASSRFPGKPLAKIAGIPMIDRVYGQVIKASTIDRVIVATDDKRIFDHCEKKGIQVIKTSPSHRSGTDRVAEASQNMACDYIINVQGDEPFIPPDFLDQLATALRAEEITIATLYSRIEEHAISNDPSRVKVVMDNQSITLYFSRSPIPYSRSSTEKVSYFQHLGVYGYRFETLQELTKLPVGKLESIEQLEQLRWLEHGYKIHMVKVSGVSPGIDTPEDLIEVERWLEEKSK